MSLEPDTEAREFQPIDKLKSPFVRFARMEAASGLLLFASTVGALAIANSRWSDLYHAVWNVGFSIQLGQYSLSASFHHWLNDGLMSIFFFLVGLEIKREILVGELSSFRQVVFPFAAAIGGTVIPALCYLALTHGTAADRGWGVPMATDIAFTLGVIALLGNRVPASLKIFVTALAIADDILAVLVIAIFYTSQVHVVALALGLAGVALALGANLLGVRAPAVYAVIGAGIWVAMLKSGVHATLAGVLLAFTIPARTYMDRDTFLAQGRRLLRSFEKAKATSYESHAALHTLESQLRLVKPPLYRIEEALQPWVSFAVMPLFAFANAGVHVQQSLLSTIREPVFLAVVAGLVLGKPLGVWSFAWLAVKSGFANRPSDNSWMSIFGASCLCGIGFTMSLFIATLAFDTDALLDFAKMGAMIGSVIAALVGSIILMRVPKPDAGGDGV